ncbi:hypothetical protein Pure05_31070 [Paenarthrobacter ureafaciens]|nr:hypothetical protein NicSoilE8_34990 [Arthrobacter sp. NicSoilE8]GLU60596.1 hypothetical protein Pure01_31090 [Paenarthrobacter ureafaciens]GLU64865.1 hypothetical protein Pure02_31150 [Paenarthrobacter ureafaciens]GLU69302.1 hypothetical protein Pure03_32780 [Paenarthrobacter ureafaciens]GLU73560.1 hypothetical protein Pure04_32750 [Paenarthrobacter ureafaciens]
MFTSTEKLAGSLMGSTLGSGFTVAGRAALATDDGGAALGIAPTRAGVMWAALADAAAVASAGAATAALPATTARPAASPTSRRRTFAARAR